MRFWRKGRRGGGRTIVRFIGGGGRRRSGTSPVKVRRALVWGFIAAIFVMMCAPKVREMIVTQFRRWFPNLVA